MREMSEQKVLQPISQFEMKGEHVNLYHDDNAGIYLVVAWEDVQDNCRTVSFGSYGQAAHIRNVCIMKILEGHILN